MVVRCVLAIGPPQARNYALADTDSFKEHFYEIKQGNEPGAELWIATYYVRHSKAFADTVKNLGFPIF